MLARVLDMDIIGLGFVWQAMDVDSLTGDSGEQIKLNQE